MKGHLRQLESRELEVLDDITRLRFEGKLPRTMTGLYRRCLIWSFYAWKTDHRDPPHFHPPMRWNSSMGPRVPDTVEYTEWKLSISMLNKCKNAVLNVHHDKIDRMDHPAKKIKSAHIISKTLLNQFLDRYESVRPALFGILRTGVCNFHHSRENVFRRWPALRRLVRRASN
ncbi:hypothetical protein B0H13DRAFT_1673454 [Mycena leptocephala]|nr:hypothetical protein B0H13DRAFT_1673454 [Mycena leptocephala]